MPQVFDNYMTAHVWAQQTQESGRSSNGNFYFEGRTLYSYGSHYVVGFIAPNGQAFLNSDSSSMTTSGKHKPAAARAVTRAFYVPDLTKWRHDVLSRIDSQYGTKAELLKAARRLATQCGNAGSPCYAWPNVDSYVAILCAIGQTPANAARLARVDFAKVERARKAAADSAAATRTARLLKSAKYFASKTARDVSRDISHELGRYYRFEIGRDNLSATGREYNAAAKAAKAKGWTQIAAKVREHYRAIRAAVRDAESRAAVAFMNRDTSQAIQTFRRALGDVDSAQVSTGHEQRKTTRPIESAQDWATVLRRAAVATSALCDCRRLPEPVKVMLRDLWADMDERATLAESKIAAEQYAAQTAARDEWRAGDNPKGGGTLSDEKGGALIRARGVKRDDGGKIIGGVLETSWRATVPLCEAVAAFRFLKVIRARGEGWNRNGQRVRVGHFEVESIAPDGGFKAACHTFNWAEIERLAVALGVFNDAPSLDAVELPANA
jgi:hypothetical protein